jgi:hypothetical protein
MRPHYNNWHCKQWLQWFDEPVRSSECRGEHLRCCAGACSECQDNPTGDEGYAAEWSDGPEPLHAADRERVQAAGKHNGTDDECNGNLGLPTAKIQCGANASLR